VGDRIAMLYQGRIREVGAVAEVRATRDPVVRQFIEGRPDGRAAERASLAGAAAFGPEGAEP
jgi:phospholipid/cholesterol/gamma-HCH transport system ATP-binding protein